MINVGKCSSPTDSVGNNPWQHMSRNSWNHTNTRAFLTKNPWRRVSIDLAVAAVSGWPFGPCLVTLTWCIVATEPLKVRYAWCKRPLISVNRLDCCLPCIDWITAPESKRLVLHTLRAGTSRHIFGVHFPCESHLFFCFQLRWFVRFEVESFQIWLSLFYGSSTYPNVPPCETTGWYALIAGRVEWLLAINVCKTKFPWVQNILPGSLRWHSRSPWKIGHSPQKERIVSEPSFFSGVMC